MSSISLEELKLGLQTPEEKFEVRKGERCTTHKMWSGDRLFSEEHSEVIRVVGELIHQIFWGTFPQTTPYRVPHDGSFVEFPHVLKVDASGRRRRC